MKECLQNERDATSAMLFSSPAIEIVVRGETRLTCCLIARARRRCPAILDLDKCNHEAHATVGVLSEKMPTCLCWSDSIVICSKMSHCKRTPAISKSLLVMSPVGLESDTKAGFKSSKKNHKHRSAKFEVFQLRCLKIKKSFLPNIEVLKFGSLDNYRIKIVISVEEIFSITSIRLF